MSILSREIKSYFRQVLCQEDGKITAQVSFPENFTGFKGHFPSNPVVPGVCLVTCILVLLELALKRKVRLKTIVLVKFLSIVRSEQEVVLELRRGDQDAACEQVKVLFRSADKKVAEMTIEVTYE
ncbi:MAG: hypothetical protein HQL20_05050 [Candidatus Omnitrophica bacterium]|nr:hypothetical protein [Candidatus Omnitrophota bacterium]